jgi:hypothetical protein
LSKANNKTITTSEDILGVGMWKFLRIVFDYEYKIMTGVWLDNSDKDTRYHFERRYSLPFSDLSGDINKDIEYIRYYGTKEHILKEYIDNKENSNIS